MPKGNLVWVWKLKVLFFKELARPKRLFLAYFGRQWCWGDNYYGQLGDGGTESYSNIPVNVSGLASGVSEVSAGSGYTCALTSSGVIKCWGDNFAGELGDGTTVQRNTPVDVEGLSGVKAISAGGWHICAITSSGGLKCWGDGEEGQLGDGKTTLVNTLPVPVAGLSSDVSEVSAGEWHTCALTSSGAAKCWGENISGEIGDGTNTQRDYPVNVHRLGSGVVEISAGSQRTCALTSGGHLKCWGDNSYFGELGDGTTADRTVPVNVVGF